MNNCGVYKFSNYIDDRVYIGSSKNLKRRLDRHLSNLRHGHHHNIHLQRFVNKHGIENLKYDIIEFCEKEDLISREINYINEYDSFNNGFNLEIPREVVWTKERREKLSQSLKTKPSNKRIYIIKENKIIDKGTVMEITIKYKLDNSSIYKILNGKRKKHKGYTFKFL